MKLMLKDVRLAFPDIFKVGKFGDYGVACLMSPKHPAVKEIEAGMLAVAKEKWGAKAEAIMKSLKATDKLCLRNGDAKPDQEGYAGNLYLTARSKVRPSVFDRDRSPLTQEDGKPYSGCYVNVSIELWAQDNKDYGKRINAGLRGVQFLRDGDAFAGGSKPASEEEFDELSVGEDTEAAADPLA